jgi:Rrf2 family protein
MRLTSATAYALRALVHLAGHGDGRLLASAAVAEAEGLPVKFLPKVLNPLVGAGVLHSARGPGGGYLLARPPKSITLLEVVEAVEGPVRGQRRGPVTPRRAAGWTPASRRCATWQRRRYASGCGG